MCCAIVLKYGSQIDWQLERPTKVMRKRLAKFLKQKIANDKQWYCYVPIVSVKSIGVLHIHFICWEC